MTVCAPRPRKTFPDARLQLESLDDRLVPAVLNLTTQGSAGVINGAAFVQANPQPTGVGVINDFLRIQSQHGAVEQGYNSSAHPAQFDEKTSPPSYRSIHLSELPTVTANGVTYRAILLGVNQSQTSPFISLDELRLYVSDSSTVSGYDATTHQLGGLTAGYDLGDNWVKLNAALSHGNGSGDMYVFVPDSVFACTSDNPDPYVYLYSKFGVHFGANGGFEQWAPGKGATLPPSVVPPPPATLSGFVYLDSNNNGVRNSGESPLAGITITLTGFDANGKPVSVSTVTLQDGSYKFTGLAAGTYTLTEELPPAYVHGMNAVGTVGGTADGSLVGTSAIGSITLHSGDVGTEYDFAVLPPQS
jgi:hypothetical protein